jgi:hypothetical protein
MNADFLCTWLGLPTKVWPPDHYTLLGLSAGDVDLPRIERQVQERMAKLRCYQLSHPEEATEGMNRLAEAFISLTEAASKAARPAPPPPRHGIPAPPPPKKTMRARPLPKSGEDTAILHKTKLDWRVTAPPVRTAVATPPAETPGTSPPTLAPFSDEVYQLARHSQEARTGLGTLAALIERIDQTRLLLVAWQRLGVYLRKKRPTTAAENAELARLLGTICDVMDVYPSFVGHPGKPGYRVVALARLAMTFDMFRNMDEPQRDDLLRDWDTGHKVFLEHRRFLRKQFKAMRRHSTIGLAMRAVRALINDHALLFGAGVVTLLVLCVVARYWLF